LLAQKNTFRHFLFANIIHSQLSALRSGPYATNTGKLFVQSIGAMITENQKLVGAAPAPGLRLSAASGSNTPKLSPKHK
jgi:hypothetical protein